MKLLIFIVVAIVAGLLVLAGIVALIGSRLPKAHDASRSIFMRQSPPDVYAVVRDFDSAPKWRSDVKQIEVERQQGGPVYFREVGKNGTVNYELMEDVPAQRMVIRIRDTDLGYSGQWTYLFAPENGGTRITIREDGEVSNVIFRFMSRYLLDRQRRSTRILRRWRSASVKTRNRSRVHFVAESSITFSKYAVFAIVCVQR